MDYLYSLKQHGHNTLPFVLRCQEGFDIGSRIKAITNQLPCKPSMTYGGNGLGQLSLKEEAAGKLRVFALVDSITQSALAPLHESLFDLLRLIPNDGTFDQEASIRRSQVKATGAGCAYSFDLSAATDRLPAVVSSELLSSLVGIPGIGDL
jgi:hypothetical protein